MESVNLIVADGLYCVLITPPTLTLPLQLSESFNLQLVPTIMYMINGQRVGVCVGVSDGEVEEGSCKAC